VSFVSSIGSYFDLAVTVASDSCTPARWIGIHKDTHFMMFLSIVHEYLIKLFSVETHFRGLVSLLEKFEICCFFSTGIFDGIDSLGLPSAF